MLAGRRRGPTLAEVAALGPGAVDARLTDARTAPHGGEPLLASVTGQGTGPTPVPPTTAPSSPSPSPSSCAPPLVHALKAPPATYGNVGMHPLFTLTPIGRPGLGHLQLDAVLRRRNAATG